MNELQVIEQNAIAQAYAKRGGTDELFDRIAQEARSFVPDVTTTRYRDWETDRKSTRLNSSH